MSRPLSFLFVLNTPWCRDLGAARVPIELAEELRALGCRAAKFSLEDAFPADFRHPRREPPTLAGRVAAALRASRSFPARAARFVRAHGRAFDIIDATQADVPGTKEALGFPGLLVSRSVALIPAYREFEQFARRRWPEPLSLRRLAWRALHYPNYRHYLRRYLDGFRCADLINVSNRDDLHHVAQRLGFGDKVVMFPFGLSRQRLAAFRRSTRPPAERLRRRTVAFIGTWNCRKGAADWPEIVGRVRAELPLARFLFLGTGLAPAAVLGAFGSQQADGIEVVPRFSGEELPGRLAAATVGAFPGYLEGFGFAVLEKLAAGLPTVAYDAPGPREMLRWQRLPTAVPPGDVQAFAAGLVRLLRLAPEGYAEFSADSRQVASRFSWSAIARDTLETYAARHAELAARPRQRRSSGPNCGGDHA